jgi:O-phosphoseryl-tRNA(Cys) synthetase
LSFDVVDFGLYRFSDIAFAEADIDHPFGRIGVGGD